MVLFPLASCLGLLGLLGLLGAIVFHSAQQPGFNQSAFVWAGLATALTTLALTPIGGFMLIIFVSYSVPVEVPFREIAIVALLSSATLLPIAAVYRLFYKLFAGRLAR